MQTQLIKCHEQALKHNFPVTLNAIHEASWFISHIPSTIIQPRLAIARDGEVNFLWKSDTAWIDLGFYGTKTYSAVMKTTNTPRITQSIRDAHSYTPQLPQQLTEWLSKYMQVSI